MPTPLTSRRALTATSGSLSIGTGSLGTINPTTDAITEYPIPYTSNHPIAITAGPDGNIWFTDSGTNAIGVATLTTSQLVVTQQPPASVTAGSGFGLTVQAEDSSGNPITSFNGTVTVALANNPGGATLGGTLSVQASDGVATFSGLTLNKADPGYTLYMSGGGFGWGVTNAITVTPAAATQVVITTQPPASVKVNSAFGLQASIEDQYGNVVTTADNTRERRVRQESHGGHSGRHAHRDGQPGRGRFLRSDDQPGGQRLHAPGLQQRPQLGRYQYHQRYKESRQQFACRNDRHRRTRSIAGPPDS